MSAHLPRFFVADGPSRPLGQDRGAHHAIDLFRRDGDLWAVTVDAAGGLALHDASARGGLDATVRRALNAQELLGPPREVFADELFLFAIERVEEPASVPGLNDPVEVTGVLFGPFSCPGRGNPSPTPPAEGSCEAPAATRGRLAATRADVLDGLLLGGLKPFHLAGALGGERGIVPIPLAGDDAEALADGRALLIGYPVPPDLVDLGGVVHDLLARAILHDLLVALRDDQREERVGTLPAREVPPPSRAALESSLAARGFRIDGDTARRPRRGLLGRLFPEKAKLPEEGSLSDFLALARVALAEMPGWPTARARALHERFALAEASWTPESAHGIEPVPDGAWSLSKDGLVSPPGTRPLEGTGRQAECNASFRNVAWRLDAAFRAHAGRAPRLEVEYEDLGAAPENISVGFDVATKDHRYAGYAHFAGSGAWRRLELTLEGARFTGRASSAADVNVMIIALAPIRIRRVTLRRDDGAAAEDAAEEATAAAAPSPGPAPAPLATAPAPPPAPAPAPTPAPAAAPTPPAPAAPAPSPEGAHEVVSWPPEKWVAFHHVALRVEEGRLVVESTGNDPHFGSPHIQARAPLDVVFRMRATGGGGQCQIHWATSSVHLCFLHPAEFPLQHDGAWHDYRVRLYELGTITRIRIDPGDAPGTFEIERFALEPVAEEPLPPAPPSARVVYFDPRYTPAWNTNCARLAEKLEAKGFTIVDAPSLAAWMRARIAAGAPGSVCIMAIDVFPDTVFESVLPTCTARRYLDAGGRIMWGGYLPFTDRGHPDGSRPHAGGHNTAQHAVGFPSHTGDLPDTPTITDEGRAFGVASVGGRRGASAVNANDVTVVLARIGRFTATAWLKTYAKDHPGSGLLKMRNDRLDGASDADVEEVARVALHGLPPGEEAGGPARADAAPSASGLASTASAAGPDPAPAARRKRAPRRKGG